MTIDQLRKQQREYFLTGNTLEYEFRVHQLKKLHNLLIENEESFMDAVHTDFGKPRFEVVGTEIAVVLQEIQFHLKHLKNWMKPVRARNSLLTLPAANRFYYQPYGNTLILSPWNYPLHLAFMPLVGAISAGNTAILKPSELTSETSGAVAESIRNTYDPYYISVVEGGVDTSQKLLRQPFDYIFFTGSTRVGKIVMKAAAEHLTPLTLELGGKSPAIVHRDADVAIAAKRIWWGKMINAGQTCVAPDFVVLHKDIKKTFIEYSRKSLEGFFQKEKDSESPDTRIINPENFQRLVDLIPDAGVVFGGGNDADNLRIEPTMIEAGWDAPSMQQEIFGPILPMILYDDIKEVIKNIQSRPSPLSLYLFTGSRDLERQIIEKIPFGGGCINDTLSHLGNPRLPFGGVGQSGLGSYHGKQSFITFSHKKSVLKKPLWPDFTFRYAPYTRSSVSWLRKFFR